MATRLYQGSPNQPIPLYNEVPFTLEMNTWLRAFGVFTTLETRIETASLRALSYTETPLTLFHYNIRKKLFEKLSNPLDSFLYLLSCLDPRHKESDENHLLVEYLLSVARCVFPLSTYNTLLAGIKSPSSKENSSLVTSLFQKKLESFFQIGSEVLFHLSTNLKNPSFLLPFLYQLLSFHLEYLRVHEKCVDSSFVENCCSALEILLSTKSSSKTLDFSRFKTSIASYLSTTAGACHLLGQLIEEVKRHTTPSLTPLNPLITTLLSWPDTDVEIPYPTLHSPYAIETVTYALFSDSTYFPSPQQVTETLIQNMPHSFAVQVALLKGTLQKAPLLDDIRLLLEMVNTYEPLKEALKPEALKFARYIQLYWEYFPKKDGVEALYQKVLEQKNHSFPKEEEDLQLFLGEIVANGGKLGSLKQRYTLLFEDLPEE